jgi:uncharacterized membrane protein YphA (DoxX/SURF4 family)
MTTSFTPHAHRPDALPRSEEGSDPGRQAFAVLRVAFTVAPIVFGVDKFTHLLTDWDRYLAPDFAQLLPVATHQAMYAVGVVEVVAGLLVLLHPRLGAVVVAAWLAGIITDLLLIPGYFDVAGRDFGLLLAAVALQRLSTAYDPRPLLWPLRRSSADAEQGTEGER